MTPIQLFTPRLVLREIIDTDLPNIFRGLSHPDVIRYYGVSYSTLEETKDQMAFYARIRMENTGIYWVVCSTQGEFIGAGGLNNIHPLHRKAELGLWILPEYWGQGLMKEAIDAICEYGFSKRNLHRLEGWVETENTACVRGLEKSGFVKEGVLHDAEWKNNRFISLAVYARLAPEAKP